MKIYNTSQNKLIADDVNIAKNFVSRSIGLLSKQKLEDNQGLIIKPCCSIHTFFMKFDIDVLFVNKKNEIIAIYKNIKPFRVLPIHFNSMYVIELKAGTADKNTLETGNVLTAED